MSHPTEPTATSIVATLTWRKKAFFTSILLLVMLALAEGAAQVYLRAFRGYAGGDFLQYEFDPYKNILLSRDWVDTRGVRHNAQGFRRTTSVVREKPEGTVRVFLMGASTAYGLGGLWPHLQREYAVLDNSQTIDAYLEPILARALPGKRVEVINAGIPSVWTHHSLIYLNQAILNYEPDAILFLDGFNDHFFYNRNHDQFASYTQTLQATGIMGPPTIKSLIRMNGWWIFRKSAFAHIVIRAVQGVAPALRGRGERRPIDVDRAVAQVQEVFERNALRMVERNAVLLKHEGVPALFMLQPLLALERPRIERMPEIERRLFEFNLEAWLPNYEQFMQRATPLISARLAERVTAQGAAYLDLTAIYPTSEGQIFTDYAHLTPEGNRRLAEHIAPTVLALLGQR